MINVEQLKQECIEIIETRYKERAEEGQENCGWGLLYSKLHTLEKSQNDFIFLGINPGDCIDPEGQNDFDYDDYIKRTGFKDYETWYKDKWGHYEPEQHPTQKQINYLLQDLLGCESENVLSGNVVPFMSPNEDYLTPKDWDYGIKVWEKNSNGILKRMVKLILLLWVILLEVPFLKYLKI